VLLDRDAWRAWIHIPYIPAIDWAKKYTQVGPFFCLFIFYFFSSFPAPQLRCCPPLPAKHAPVSATEGRTCPLTATHDGCHRLWREHR
jgi:hypothetical protein